MPSPLFLPFDQIVPDCASAPMAHGEGAVIIGRSTVGNGLRMAAFAVARGDGNDVRVGDDAFLGPGATLHIVHATFPCILGHRVTVGANACVHACEVGDDVVIGRDCVILDGSVVGAGVILEAGSLVFPRTTLEPGMIYAGRPAKPTGPADAKDRDARAAAIRADLSADWRPKCHAAPIVERHPTAYLAATARISGALEMAEATSLWFGCAVEAAGGPVVIGARTNVQDNTRIITRTPQGVRIGPATTIGHNVLIEDCEIAERCLIGIGAHVAEGTIVEPDVLLAGGAVTMPGQVLTAGAVWGGAPARRLSAFDDAKRDMIARIVKGYCAYAEAYLATPGATLSAP